jgi:hypothetical protein
MRILYNASLLTELNHKLIVFEDMTITDQTQIAKLFNEYFLSASNLRLNNEHNVTENDQLKHTSVGKNQQYYSDIIWNYTSTQEIEKNN